MSHDAWMATCIARLTKVSQLDDAEFCRAWNCCASRALAAELVDSGTVLSVESMERMAAIDVDYRSQPALGSASGITNVFEVQVSRALLHPCEIVRILDCCSGKNIALVAELVRAMLDRLPQLIPLASQHLIQLCHQSVCLPTDRKPNELSLRGLAYLTLAEGGTRYAPDVIHADIAQQECVETLWNWRLVSATRRKLYHYEDVVNAMMDAIRQCRSATSG